MAIQLRPYQNTLKEDIRRAWQYQKNVLAVMPTGAGKTVTMADIIRENNGASFAIAHRQELVGQISMALAREGVFHNIIAPKNVVKLCVKDHTEELGRSFFTPHAQCSVAGVDTLIRRGTAAPDVTLWVMDEAHHVLRSNKWGRAVELFPNARGLGVTATPNRTDGKGVGRRAEGVFDTMETGPTMRELIRMGYLTDYRVFAPPSDLDLSDVKVSVSTGDFTREGLTTAIKRSQVIGDIVSHYTRIAPGKLGVSFLPDVETATNTAVKFREAGVAAEIVHAGTSDYDRRRAIKRFAKREILQLVNVDLFGEGFDLPAIEVVSMGRPTQSLGLYIQQFGRGLRIMDGKLWAIIIDHVGNVMRHGLPDAKREWSLDGRNKRSGGSNEGVTPVTTCGSCCAVYERYYKVCPFCGFATPPTARSAPEFVDGDLTELDAETLARMRGEVATAQMSIEEYEMKLMAQNMPTAWRMSHMKYHRNKLETHKELREAMAVWAGHKRAQGYDDSQSYRMFYLAFGVDALTAQTLGNKEAIELVEKINKNMGVTK